MTSPHPPRTARFVWWGENAEERLVTFEESVRTLVDWYDLRCRDVKIGSPAPDGRSPDDWLKLLAYEIVPVLELKRKGVQARDAFELKHKRYLQGPKPVSPFQRFLGTCFGTDNRRMPASKRERIGKQLQYAFNHYVPAEFLLAFTEMVGVEAAIYKLAVPTIEDDLKDRILRKRSKKDPARHLRGPYPPPPVKKRKGRLGKVLNKFQGPE